MPENYSIEQRRQQLFNAYIKRMFARRRGAQFPAREQELAIRWLGEIAYHMSQPPQTVFLIEKIQPIWLRFNLQDLEFAIFRRRKI
ncbi:MAG: hypothetical protein N3E45_08045 [Oscillatoriaceae bacterium SKW80]|nr:hypothetical protein [Oscillatoriaceae bacterium SKYG93]MCX8120769.1 hypothetical protein [Oscillatoriaceae bacterium SKW80]MDW8452134.1 hypothetical protein [Oscillatoriaceae cyanobacterium SKYGB_i_bin93]HIK27769.1 hypothetical protein [Oscillatoriaceae cyanobacterium M7585_C2015_266]